MKNLWKMASTQNFTGFIFHSNEMPRHLDEDFKLTSTEKEKAVPTLRQSIVNSAVDFLKTNKDSSIELRSNKNISVSLKNSQEFGEIIQAEGTGIVPYSADLDGKVVPFLRRTELSGDWTFPRDRDKGQKIINNILTEIAEY